MNGPPVTGDQWSVAYPPGWFVHPADSARGVAACTLFGREAFQAEPEGDWGWSGAQVVMGLEAGCRGSFEVVMTHEELEVDGFAASRQLLQDGHGGQAPLAYEYFVDLTPGRACEVGRWFYARTESDDPGDFEAN